MGTVGTVPSKSLKIEENKRKQEYSGEIGVPTSVPAGVEKAGTPLKKVGTPHNESLLHLENCWKKCLESPKNSTIRKE